MVRLRWEREGVKDGCYNLLLAVAACPWPDRSAIGYFKRATCVADLDSRALALTKEASGNSREDNKDATAEVPPTTSETQQPYNQAATARQTPLLVPSSEMTSQQPHDVETYAAAA